MLDTIIASIVTALITSVGAAALAYFGYWRQAAAELKKELNNRYNEQKWKAYQDFMKLQSRAANTMKPEGAEIRIALLLTASDEVIRAFNDYVDLSYQDDRKDERHERIGAMIAAMRKDLGYDTKLSYEELWTTFSMISEK